MFSAETKWVLKASSQALGHGDHYYTGAYDQRNQTFSPDVHGVYDYGSKFYASKSFLDNNPILSVPRQVLWAWIKYLSTTAAATTTKHTTHYRTRTTVRGQTQLVLI